MRILTSAFLFALSFSAFGQVPDYVPADGLIAWYPFNGNVLDESPNGNDGVISGSISLNDDRFGNTNSSQLFSGNSLTYLDCGNNPILNIENEGNLSISTWIQVDENTLSSAQDVVLSKNSTNYTNVFGAYTLWLNLGVPNFTVTNQGGNPNWYQTATGTSALEVDTWYLLTTIVDRPNGELRLYVNGDLVGSDTWGGTIDSNPVGKLFVGCHFKADFGSQYMYNFGGSIDDVGLWSRVLSPSEILALYTVQLPMEGCMDSLACNYFPGALVDDGSCDYSCCPGPGCCDLGMTWSWELSICQDLNPTDSNLDGCTDLMDLMDLLAAYGNCGVAGFTSCGDDIEHEGFSYSTVQIGDQCWFSENCRYLPEVSPSSVSSTSDPYYYVYDYEGSDVEAAKATANYATYGVLYNWPAVMTEDICPSGWHIPTDLEWQTMEMSLGMSASDASSSGWRGTDEGYQMKSTSGWNYNGNGSNSSGFTGLPGGYRYSGGFYFNGYYGYGWSASEAGSNAWLRDLNYSYDIVYRRNYARDYGFSARCVID
jgi:uncharacterized protein (TIGR02145 family)